MMCVVGNRLWPATTELAFMFCHIVQPNTAGVTQRGKVLENCPMTNCYCSSVHAIVQLHTCSSSLPLFWQFFSGLDLTMVQRNFPILFN